MKGHETFGGIDSDSDTQTTIIVCTTTHKIKLNQWLITVQHNVIRLLRYVSLYLFNFYNYISWYFKFVIIPVPKPLKGKGKKRWQSQFEMDLKLATSLVLIACFL